MVLNLLRTWVALLWGLLLAGSAGAEPILLTAVPDTSLGMQASVLVEDGTLLGLAQVRARQKSGEFLPGTRPVLTFGIGARPVWVRLELRNPTERPLSFRLMVGTTWIDQLDVYLIHAGRVSASWQTGDRYPQAPGATPAAGFVFSPVFPPGFSEIYLRAETADPLVLPLVLMAPDKVSGAEQTVHYWYGFFYGFLIALAIYNGMLYAGLRKRGHFYYALYLLSFILLNIAYTGHGYAWWWSAEPGFQRYVILVLMVLFSCCGLLFACRFLGLAEQAPRMLRGVRLFVLGGLGLLGLSLMLDSQYGAALLAFCFLTLFTLFMVVLGSFAMRRKLFAGGYFLVAALFGMGGAAATSLSVWGWLPFNEWTYHGAEIGILFEATLLALALAAQMRLHDVARQSAEQLARIDPLTGLHNRRSFLELAEPIWSTAVRNGRPLSLIMLDVDYFKQINDQYGHEVGDRVLGDMARLLTQSSRAGDILARWGGEEFVLLLPETDLTQAALLAERMRQLIAAQRLAVKQQFIAFTASFGVVERSEQAGLETLLREADVALYQAKARGRNQVVSPADSKNQVAEP